MKIEFLKFIENVSILGLVRHVQDSALQKLLKTVFIFKKILNLLFLKNFAGLEKRHLSLHTRLSECRQAGADVSRRPNIDFLS